MQWLLNGGAFEDIQDLMCDVTVRSHCFLIYQVWKFIYPLINLWDALEIAYLRWSPQHEKVEVLLFYRQSASCEASRLSLQSAVMEWWMLWRTDRLFFCSLLTCPMAHTYYSMNFLMSSHIFLPVIACLIPDSVISKSTGEAARVHGHTTFCIFRKIWPVHYQYKVFC